MPRKAFVADLHKAVDGLSVSGISHVRTGADDGEFTFQCSTSGESLRISALVPDLGEYPSSHTYMIFGPDDAPKHIANQFMSIADEAEGKTVLQLLELVALRLGSMDRDGDKHMLNTQEIEDFDDDDSAEEYSEEEYFPDEENIPRPTFGRAGDVSVPEGYTKPTSAFRARIRSDLLTAKANGFKVGHHGGLMDGLGCYVSLSCRISKLGVSEEAMQAWQIEPAEYLIVLFQYPNGYKPMESIQSYDAHTARLNLQMRVGISHTYKPTLQECIQAFSEHTADDSKHTKHASQSDSQPQDVHSEGLRNSFISRPLNELLNERFPTLLSYRYNGMPWAGAEQFYNDHYGTNHSHSAHVENRYLAEEDVATTYPAIVMADHISEQSGDPEHSLPLVGMQFVLRHFVRCTEFCLVCFTKLADDLQAIKPYVCDNPLCLYQYMSLGFGPSIEHEILSQPKVVDLLISFAYISARNGKLKHFPTGLSLMVPPSEAYCKDYPNQQHQHYINQWGLHPPPPPPPPPTQAARPLEKSPLRFNAATGEMIFEDPDSWAQCPFKTGDWIMIRTQDGQSSHCRVIETTYFPTVKVADLITSNIEPVAIPDPHLPNHNTSLPAKPSGQTNTFQPANFHRYDQNFDELDDFHKREAIYALLDVLPPVSVMTRYLLRGSQSLRNWVDRLSPAVLGILRWIIASNRACIVQVDGDDPQSPNGKKGEARLYGMPGWVQFRFAMGAPDKERRFIRSVREASTRLALRYPTLFAWHGSPIGNWHSIIREGLHFNVTAHGRAYGHGVYHSLDSATSIGYSSGYHNQSGAGWSGSELKATAALALNEIINAPKEFVSCSPHLVVAQLDWIQTRYLFVSSAGVQAPMHGPNVPDNETKPLECIEQDPKMTPKGSGGNLIIPIHALSGSRRPQSRDVKKGSKRLKSSGTMYDPIDVDADDDDGASVATLEEDLVIFEDEDVVLPESEGGPVISGDSGKGKPKTDFVPGTLDHSTLPMIEPPAWATPMATKQLQTEFKDLLKIQQKDPLHALGWYIDPEHVSNLYQWIVELHSFDPTLPLAKDMKSRGITSIVLEIRFGKDFPMSPPFVRAIRPRFLGFQQGGGGHVTAGGALCMELLTNSGWLPSTRMESVLLQIRLAISSLDPRPARLENGSRGDYGIGEAVEAYLRACQTHGWKVPDGFKEMAYGGASNAQPGYYQR
jgi:ubiquitin-conjugating enzyme E2 Q